MNKQLFPWVLCAGLALLLAAQNVDQLPTVFSSAAVAESTAPPAVEPEVLPSQDEPQAVYEVSELLKKRAESGSAYLSFMNIPTMSLGIYSLPKDGTDGQSPHGQDEIYYVLGGKAKINIEGAAHAVQEGSIIFVAAGDEHKFVEIEEDLDLLVFFSKAPPGGE